MEKIKDFLLGLLENFGSKLSCWAWDKRWKERKHITQKEWVKGYREWKTK